MANPLLRPLPLLGCLVAGLVLPTFVHAQSFKDNIIKQRCTQAATDDFAKMAKTPPAGFIPFTCGCLVQQLNAQVPLDQAKVSCRAQAIAKFGTP